MHVRIGDIYAHLSVCRSIDGLRRPAIRNAHVPLWNYTLLRVQVCELVSQTYIFSTHLIIFQVQVI